MSVHYKLKAALYFSTLTFDGTDISVSDLKKEIEKHYGDHPDFYFQIQNADSKEVYQNDDDVVPANTSVIVARVPIAEKIRSHSESPPGPTGGMERFAPYQQPKRLPGLSTDTRGIDPSTDLVSMNATEEEKINVMMAQSTAEYDPSRYQKIRGAGQEGRVPDNYVCFKCDNHGHWIKNCPFSHNTKKSTGIPFSSMVFVDGPEFPGALITPGGQYAVPATDLKARCYKMSVHYKFKAALDFSTVTLDGTQISVSDLKKEIMKHMRVGNNADFELQIQNSQNKQVYGESVLIYDDDTVIVVRVPVTEKMSECDTEVGSERKRFKT